MYVAIGQETTISAVALHDFMLNAIVLSTDGHLEGLTLPSKSQITAFIKF